MLYSIEETDRFRKGFGKLPKEIQQRFQKQFNKLPREPYDIGKPLSFKWLRELKNKSYRAYYLVYDEKTIILLVAVSNKKDQEMTIAFIKSNKEFFKDYIMGNSKGYKL